MPILSKAQAEAIYSAVRALNNVSANSGIELSFVGATDQQDEAPMRRVTYAENAAGEVVVFTGPAMSRTVQRERYVSQSEFANVYGL